MFHKSNQPCCCNACACNTWRPAVRVWVTSWFSPDPHLLLLSAARLPQCWSESAVCGQSCLREISRAFLSHQQSCRPLVSKLFLSGTDGTAAAVSRRRDRVPQAVCSADIATTSRPKSVSRTLTALAADRRGNMRSTARRSGWDQNLAGSDLYILPPQTF